MVQDTKLVRKMGFTEKELILEMYFEQRVPLKWIACFLRRGVA